MEALYWGTKTHHPGTGAGPWVMGDLENGVWAGNASSNPSNQPIHAEFVTAMLKGDTGNHWTLKGGDAQTGALQTLFDGQRPPRYHPMKKQGALILGIGGDNSHGGVGTFYEGLVTTGFTSDAADDAVQADIVGAGYGR